MALLLVVTLGLRFPHLGYSDYIGDEHKAFFQPAAGQSVWNFFMEQRKGPMQFAISYIPYLFTHNWRNELAERILFTIFNVASVFVFYALVKKLTKDWRVAFLAASLLSTNGFIVGFSRIAQYQNLNLFFSFLALYFYSDFRKRSLFGTVAFSLSLLSHWDAIFILPLVAIFLRNFLLDKSVPQLEKTRILITNFVLGSLILLPFLVPYIWHQISHAANKEYFTRRVELGNFNLRNYIFLIKLYNPFFTLEFLLVAIATSLLFIKRTWMYLVWFTVNFSLFAIFVKKPDTHVYNFVIPAILLGSVGLVLALEALPRFSKYLFTALTSIFLIFFAYQSYVIFVDHKVEYPWRREQLLGKNFLRTQIYNDADETPLFGFPLSRGWNEINNFVNAQNDVRGENFGYQTNEAKTISEWYMDVGYRQEGFYAIGIKWPLSFANDMKFTQFGRKEVVYEKEKDGEVVVRIYRVPF